MSTLTELRTIALAALLLSAGTPGRAQEGSPVPQGGETAPVVEPVALAALDKMGAYLRTLNRFEIHSQASIDEVLDSGQKLQFERTVHLRARRPTGLWAEIASDRKTREFFYDGKTFTLWGPRNKFYSSIPAPPTIKELADLLEERYGLVLPLVDLFRWGNDPTLRAAITGAIHVGPARIAGDLCDHYAFRQQGVDWQVWIQNGDRPLPRKLVITSIDEEAQPQFTSVLAWNLAPVLSDQMFTFAPPPGAQRIAIQESTTEPTDP